MNEMNLCLNILLILFKLNYLLKRFDVPERRILNILLIQCIEDIAN